MRLSIFLWSYDGSVCIGSWCWHGAWCWKRVLPILRVAGYEAHAVSLAGVGEKAHLLNAQLTCVRILRMYWL